MEWVGALPVCQSSTATAWPRRLYGMYVERGWVDKCNNASVSVLSVSPLTDRPSMCGVEPC